jgi:hypothetical protein
VLREPAHTIISLLALLQKPLPPDSPIFCGHEYTVENLRFALWVDPGNAAVSEKLAWAMRMRSGGQSTVPSLLSEERDYNPFLRVHVAALRAAGKGLPLCCCFCCLRSPDGSHPPLLRPLPAVSGALHRHAAQGGQPTEGELAEVPALAALRRLKNAKAHVQAQGGAGAGGDEGSAAGDQSGSSGRGQSHAPGQYGAGKSGGGSKGAYDEL